MNLDRELQLNLLKTLAGKYPLTVDLQSMTKEHPIVTPNLHYLAEHGLIDGQVSREIGGSKNFIFAKITARGLDFLADDGGLGAILGVVTIKLHDDTVRELITLRVQNSNLPPEEKQTLIDQLRELRGESLKHLTMKLLDAGLENWPVAMTAIQAAVSAIR